MEANGRIRLAYAVVADLAASWADYEQLSGATYGSSVSGLMLHAAGPTDDGFRTIDLWGSEDAWLRHRDAFWQACEGLIALPTVRELGIHRLVTVEQPR